MMKSKNILWLTIFLCFNQNGHAQNSTAPHSENIALESQRKISYANNPIHGVLKIHPTNPAYFTDESGRAIYLTGSHTWSNLCDMAGPTGFQSAEHDAFLGWIAGYGHNFTRLWAMANDGFIFSGVTPLVYARTGPGLAKDGKPKFDLSRFNEPYFERLKAKVRAAYERGIYVSIMLFGHAGHLEKDTYLKKENNINGLDGDPNGDGNAMESRQLRVPAITAFQERYVKKVVEELNEFDNVLFEIACESDLTTTEWQYHMIRYVRKCEANLPKQHLVGMSSDGGYGPGDDTKRLFDSPADWICPGWDSDTGSSYMKDPPPSTGKKVVLVDTDHLWGVGGDSKWVWKSFTRGLHPNYMDPYLEMDPRATMRCSQGQFDSARRAMGKTLALANRIDLAKLKPNGQLSSSGYCLTDPGNEYVIYLPEGHDVSIDLFAAPRKMNVEWIEPVEGTLVADKKIMGGNRITFHSPFKADAVLHIVIEK